MKYSISNIGEKITSIEQIYQLKLDKKSVYHTVRRRHFAAACIINEQAIALIEAIKAEQLFIYIPKQK